MIIAIDGPAGVGKSTCAFELAKKLGFTYVDSGAMYRNIALQLKNLGIDFDSETAIIKALKKINLQKIPSANIRDSAIGLLTAKIASIKEVRSLAIKEQRKYAKLGNIVMEGRDIGSIVFPSADLKIFLTASLQTRARRRQKDFQIKNRDISIAEIEKEIQKRDLADQTRKISPLIKANDAIEINTDKLSQAEVLYKIESILKTKLGIKTKKQDSIYFYLGLITQLGLTMIITILLFFFLGFFLDRWLKTEIIFTGFFIVLGVISGFYLVYRQIDEVLK